MKRRVLLAVGVLALAALPGVSHAQGISITPQIGFYVPGNDLDSLRAGAQSVRVNREGNLALGLNIDIGFLRGSLAYASSAKLNDQTSTNTKIGDAKVLAVAGDVVLRPIPRLIIVQPYLLLGAGLRRTNYSYESSGISNAFPKDDSDFALHGGVGADIMLGPIGVSAEITDFVSKNTEDKWKQHDAFGFVGLKLKI